MLIGAMLAGSMSAVSYAENAPDNTITEEGPNEETCTEDGRTYDDYDAKNELYEDRISSNESLESADPDRRSVADEIAEDEIAEDKPGDEDEISEDTLNEDALNELTPDGDGDLIDFTTCLSGDGSKENPFLIGSEADFDKMRAYYADVDANNRIYEDLRYDHEHFKLTQNLILEGEWEPIRGSSSLYFDGNDHQIAGISIRITKDNYQDEIRFRDSNEGSWKRTTANAFILIAGEIRNLNIWSAEIRIDNLTNQSNSMNMCVFACRCYRCIDCSLQGDVEFYANNESTQSIASCFCSNGSLMQGLKMQADVTSDTWILTGITNSATQYIDCGIEGYLYGACKIGIVGIGWTGYAGSLWYENPRIENCYTAKTAQIYNFYGEKYNSSSAFAAGISAYMGTEYLMKDCVNNGLVHSDYGAAAGISHNASGNKTMVNCVNNGPVEGGYSAAGICTRFTGIGNDNDYSMMNCVNNGEVTQDAAVCNFGRAAGITYEAESCVIISCTNNGEISSNSASGIAGRASSATIEKCANYGKLTNQNSNAGIAPSGGILGTFSTAYSDEVLISNCYNAGEISCQRANSRVGGILGDDRKDGNRTGTTKLTIENCYNVGKITKTNSSAVVGAIVGEITGNTSNTSIRGMHYLGGTASSPFGKGSNSAYKAKKNSDTEMKQASTYSGWDFGDVWTMGTGDYRYPIFAIGSNSVYTITLDANGGTVDGKQSVEVKTNKHGNLMNASRPYRDESRFMGWYTEADGGTRITQEYAFVEDTTIYAHWGTYDPEKRVALENLIPVNGATEVSIKDAGNWRNLEISFKTSKPVSGFDTLSGTIRLVDYETNETVYDLTSPGVLKKTAEANGSRVSFTIRNSGPEYGHEYTVEIDEGFLIFEEEDYYAYTESHEAWHFRTESKPEVRKIRIRDEHVGRDAYLNYDFEYNDAYFAESATEYHHKRTIWAMGLAMAGFESYEGGSWNGYKDGAKNARDMLTSFGFTCSDFSDSLDYKYKPDTYTFGSFIASKEITVMESGSPKDYTLIAIATRGAGYENEWFSNGDVGNHQYHEGFMTASQTVLSHLNNYITKAGITGDVKIVIAGYSRAGATTNLVAASIDDGLFTGDSRISVEKKDVYAYCFEPPACSQAGRVSGYENITNIINPADIVPKVPLAGDNWGFRRFGKTYYLPGDMICSDYSSKKERFLETYEDLLGYSYDNSHFVKFSFSFGNLKDYAFELLNPFYDPQEDGYVYQMFKAERYSMAEWEDEFVENLNAFVSVETFVDEMQSEICKLLGKFVANGDYNTFILSAFPRFKDLAKAYGNGTANRLTSDMESAIYNSTTSSYGFGLIMQEHDPQVNFAWLISLKGEPDFSTGEYGVAKLNCPVNAVVRNSEGQIVASIINDAPQEIPGSSILSCLDDKGQKIFILPNDDGFSIEITGTDEGTMDYSVSSYSYSEGGIVDKTVYYDKAVTSGATYSASITEDGTKTLKQNNAVIDPDKTINGEIPEHEVSVRVSDGDGSVLGEGVIQEGDHVKLTAVPEPGAQFIGWYKNETDEIPVSTAKEYRFRVENKDVLVYAKFSEVADDVFVVDIPDQTYTGSAIKPEVMIFDQKTKLTAGKDYMISYKNNKNAYTIGEGEQGFNKKKAPQAVIKMKGNYSGKKTIYFKILPMELSSGSFSASDLTAQYNGKKQTPSPILTRNGKKLKLNTDYVVEEYQTAKNDKTAFKGAADEDTVYTLTLTGKKNYTGSKKLTLTILGKTAEGEDGEVTQVMMNSVKVPSIPAQTYRKDEEGRTDITVDNILDKKGKPLPFTVTWQKSKTEKYTFTQNVDYKVTYRKNSEIGTASIILTGLGNKQNENGIALVGTKTVTFKITGKNLKGAKITGLASTYPYSGEEVIPTGYKVTLSGKELKAGDDYRVAFSKNVNAGTATMTVSGTGAYTGKVKKTFKIGKASIGERGSKSDSVTVNNGEEITAAYKKSGAKPVITLKWLNGEGEEDDMILTEGVDFKVKYQNTSNLSATAPASKMPVAIITGTGSFTGSFKVPLTITPAPFSPLKDNAYANDRAYSNKKGDYKASAVIADADGKLLKAGTDYEITEYALVGSIDPSTGNYVNLYPPTYLDQISRPDIGSRIRMTVKAKGNYVSEDENLNTIYLEYSILAAGKDISNAKVTLKGSKPFNGSSVKLSAEDFKSVKLGNEYLEYGTDFEIDENSYVNHNKKGIARVTLIGKGSYGGRQTIKFQIGTRAFKGSIWKRILGLFS